MVNRWSAQIPYSNRLKVLVYVNVYVYEGFKDSVGAVGPLRPSLAQSHICLRLDCLCALRRICPKPPAVRWDNGPYQAESLSHETPVGRAVPSPPHPKFTPQSLYEAA